MESRIRSPPSFSCRHGENPKLCSDVDVGEICVHTKIGDIAQWW